MCHCDYKWAQPVKVKNVACKNFRQIEADSLLAMPFLVVGILVVVIVVVVIVGTWSF